MTANKADLRLIDISGFSYDSTTSCYMFSELNINHSHSSGAVEMSKAALYFANAAKRVTMQPVVNEVLNERARMRRLQTEIDSLRQQLVSTFLSILRACA